MENQRLNILAVCQHYWPEPFNVHEICAGLVDAGHNVTVLTGLPNYPDGVIAEEYKRGRNRECTKDGVKIVRAPIIARGKDLKGINRFKRVLNYFSFCFSGSMASRKLRGFDLVIAFEFSPILMVEPAIRVSKRERIPLVIYAFDLWPEDLITGGISKTGSIYRIMKRYSARTYSKANAIAVTSPDFMDYMKGFLEVEKPDYFYLPQYAEEMFESLGSDDANTTSRAEAYACPRAFNIVFAGNIGGNQALDSAIRAMSLLDVESSACLNIYGGGSRLGQCMELTKSLGVEDRVRFHGRKPLNDMPEVYAEADAMLLSLAGSKNESLVSACTIPRKLQSYMAAGKPILASVDGVAGRIVSEAGAGLSCGSEVPEQLAEAIREMEAMSIDELGAMGRSSREYYENNFSRKLFFLRLEDIVTKVVQK